VGEGAGVGEWAWESECGFARRPQRLLGCKEWEWEWECGRERPRPRAE